MLAHLKAKQKETDTMAPDAGKPEPATSDTEGALGPMPDALSTDNTSDATRMTVDVLTSLKSTTPSPPTILSSGCEEKAACPRSKTCPKQLQLPMFLSKTYHMIDKCDSSIATWSEAGDNFVVKNVEKFATCVLPQYFKHSNFSSFARQLNFYGFRKLKAEPILTADYDAHTACYVRFYHEKFRRDEPELLVQIKRATKSEQQSKDDVDSMKSELSQLKETVCNMSSDFDRRMAEMSYEYNRRITTLSAEYDKLAVLLHQLLAQQHGADAASIMGRSAGVPDMMQSLSQVAALSLKNVLVPPPSMAATNAVAGLPPTAGVNSSGIGVSKAAAGEKRPASDEAARSEPSPTRPRMS